MRHPREACKQDWNGQKSELKQTWTHAPNFTPYFIFAFEMSLNVYVIGAFIKYTFKLCKIELVIHVPPTL